MIEKTYRQKFLEEFLKFYKVCKVEYNFINDYKISGIAIYDLNDLDERQEFCWHMDEENVPRKEVFEIINIINENGWCDVDKITISENELFDKLGWPNRTLFDRHFEKLFEVEIKMVDNGEETDSFFVHK